MTHFHDHIPAPGTPEGEPPIRGARRLDRELEALKHRLIDEARAAVAMVEASLASIHGHAACKADAVVARDRVIDTQEVELEEACLAMLTLQQPVASDLRRVVFILKTNAEIERTADHAVSIAKVVRRLSSAPDGGWPTSLVELAERVPIACHQLLRAFIDEDAALAKTVIAQDKSIDRLAKELFNDTIELLRDHPDRAETGLHLHRLARELERVGDLLTNIAEHVVYLVSGDIIRHTKKQIRAEVAGGEGRSA